MEDPYLLPWILAVSARENIPPNEYLREQKSLPAERV